MRSPRAAHGNSRARSASTSYVTDRLDARSRFAQFRWGVVRLPLPATVRPEVLAGIAPHPPLAHVGEARCGGVDVGLDVAGTRHLDLLDVEHKPAVGLARSADEEERSIEPQG